MFLIDTDIVIWTIRGNEIYTNILQKLKDRSILSISAITIAEVYKNAFTTEYVKTEEVLSEYFVLDVIPTIAKQGGLYWQYYSKKLKNISIIDCIIAATAREHTATLCTLNTRHFPMDDIIVLDPAKMSK